MPNIKRDLIRQLRTKGVEVQSRQHTIKSLKAILSALDDNPQKRFAAVIDEFKNKKPEIFARRHFKTVIQEVKNYKRPSITIDLPVEQTDPPTLNQAGLKRKLDDIDFNSYNISFSITNEGDFIGENGEVETRQEKTTGMAPILKMRVKNNTIGALKGFLENYMKRHTKGYDKITKITLQLTRVVKKPAALTPLKDGMQMNCVIDVIDKALQNRKDYRKTLRPKIREINAEYFDAGVTEEAIDVLCSKLKINIRVVSILQETWYHKHTGDTRLTVLVCGHNGHATPFIETKNMTDFLVKKTDGKVTYVDDLIRTFRDDPTPIKFPMVVNEQIVAYYDYDGNLFKNHDIFFDEADFKKNKKNDDLKNVFTLTSRYYKNFKNRHDLQDMYFSEELYHFVRCADQYSPPWCTDEKYATLGQAFDQDRAYMFYEKSQYYEHYQFPRMPTHFYKVVEQNPALLRVTGFAQVDKVMIPQNLTYIKKTRMIQDGCIYTTMRLAWLAELGVTFNVTRIAFSNDKQKLDFHITLTEEQSNHGKSAKQEECSLMGRLIPSQQSTFTSLVSCKDENEFLQLRYQLGSKVLKVDFEDKIIYYTEESEKRLRGAYHVHAYILDYQQIEFATKAMTQKFENILKVKVDCIVLKKPTKDDLATSLAAKADGLFTREQIQNWLLTEPVEMIQPKIDGWGEGNGNPTKWAGFHEEKNIKDAKTALISEVDFTHRKYIYQPDLTELPEVAFHRYIEFTGSAGTAKTYTATHLGLWDACVLVPNNALRVKFKTEHPELPCTTYHKQFNTNKGKSDYVVPRRAYSNYILDECSMICKGVMNQILSHKLALNANFIIIHDRAQLAPVMPGNENWEEPEDRYFTNGKEYKKRNWHQIHLTKQMRQNDPKFIELLDKMRILHDQKDGGLQEMIALMKDRIISERDALSLYRYDFQDLMIASTNEEVDRWNKMLLKQSGPGQLKLKYTKTNRTHVNNERVILQKEIEQNQELAFASTVHIIQGLTFPDRLFISLSLQQKRNNFDNHLLYTAVSRVKSLDQLYLVEV